MSSRLTFLDEIRKKVKTGISDTAGLTFSFSKPPSELVFSNSVITQEIFSNLEINSLKICRRVCRQWNEVVLPFMSTKCAVNLNKLFNQPQETIISVPNITTNLVRYVYVDFDKTEDEFRTGVRLSNSQQLTLICEKYKDQIRGISVSNSDGNDLIRPLRIVLNICEHLEELSLFEFGNMDEGEDKIVDSKGFIPQSLNLKKFELSNQSYSFPPHLERFVSRIIRASQNLIHLHLEGINYYPNLSFNSNLKILFVTNIEHDLGDLLPHFSLSELERMIKDVSGSLEKLELNVESFSPLSTVSGNLTLSQMPKLKVFVNRALHIFPIKSLTSFGECPNLTELELFGPSLDNCGMDYIFKSSKRNSNVFKSVTKLEVVQFKNVSAVYSLTNFFPCLSILKFEFGISDGNLTNKQIQNLTASQCLELSIN